MNRRPLLTACITLTVVLSACGSTKPAANKPADPKTAETKPTGPSKRNPIVLLAYDSFVLSKGTLESFTAKTGIAVSVVTQGDAGELVNSAILTKDDPESGVMWGVDSTFLTRAIDEKIFTPYASPALGDLDPALTGLVPGNEVTPVDFGDVCVNYDKAALAKRGVEPPKTLEDLVDPKYKGMLVVQGPATSSPGLAFLLATISRFGDKGWKQYWTKLKANDVKVVSGWTEAYETWFSAGTGKGDRPLVVSYGSSPSAAVLFGPDPKASEAPTGVVADTCFRQVEFAGILNGTKGQAEAQELLDFLLSPTVQEDMQLNMFVYPSNTKAKLDPLMAKFAVVPDNPNTLDPTAIAKGREGWIDEWTDLLG
jgi:thiamine transport system substrate-binding protein